MKIKSRLKLNTWFSLGAVSFMLFSVVWSFSEANRTDQNVLLIHEIERTAFERIILRDDWLLNQGERAKIQWYAKTETLRELLESASQRLTSKEAKELLQAAKKDFEATFSLFPILLEKYKRERITIKKKFDFTEAESRLISQVFLKAYSLNDNISRLHELCRREAIAARNTAILLIIIFIVGGITAMVINSVAISAILAKRVEELNNGLMIIGKGNLDHSLSVKGDDELADLARISNEMVVKLKQSYTSMENLQKEIYERQLAEEKIKSLSIHQQTLLGAIPDIITEVDTNKIYTWVNAPGIEFFGKDVIGKAADFYFVREQTTYDVVQPIFKGYEEVIYVESWQKREDGEERLLAWWCRVLKDAQGNVTGALSSARDITDWKQAESQREALLEEIKKLNEELEQRVSKRTIELTAKTFELERINKVFVDRELRMRELKKKIAEMEKEKK